jgi:outer membrane protein assembly factor BamB
MRARLQMLLVLLLVCPVAACYAQQAKNKPRPKQQAKTTRKASPAKSSSPADWTQFRGPDGQADSAAPGVPVTWSAEENVVWKQELPGPGTSCPITIGDKIFLTCYSGYNVPGAGGGDQEDLRRHVLCLDRDSGRIAWDQQVESKLPEQESIRDDHGYASNTPAADNDQVYVFFGKSGVFAFDHAGNQQWQTDVGDGLNGWGSAASPVLYNDLVIVNASVESQSLVALNKHSGKEAWRVEGINESWNTPILVQSPGGRTELVLAIMGKVLSIDPDSGEQLWSCDTDIGWYMVPSLVAADGVVYCIGGRSGGSLAVRTGGKGDVTRTHRLWTGTKGSNVSSPVLHEGRLYWMNDNSGIAYCADAATGEVLYEERVVDGDQVYASPVLADGKVYYISRGGRAFVIAAQPKFELLATNEVEHRGMFNAGFTVDGSRLLLRSNKYLYCLGER